MPRMSKPYNKLGIATTLAGESVYILLNENTLYELNVESFIWKPIEATPPDGVSFTSISKILYEPDTFSLYGDKYLFTINPPSVDKPISTVYYKEKSSS